MTDATSQRAANERGDVRRMLLLKDWQHDDYPSRVLRKGNVTWAPSNYVGDSAMSGRGHRGTWTVGFPTDVPARVIVAACEAAAR